MNVPELKIEYRPLDFLVEYARNPRKNDPVVEKMASGIREFGFRYPILVKSDGSVVDGHLRIKAARKLGLKEIPTVCADDMTEAQIKAFRLYVNRVPEDAEWDGELVGLQLEEIREMGFDMDLTGFDKEELADLMDNDRESRTPKEETLKPFKQTHVLLSFPPEKILELQPLLESILKIEGIEYEQSSN
jgi:ParB-like chromosome segregation protein Spo0J